MPISRAEIPAKDPQELLERLCREWSNAQPIDREEHQVRITFDEGSCLLRADADELVVAVETLEDGTLDQLEGRVNAALEGLAGVELEIVWET